MEPVRTAEPYTRKVSEELDRLEVPAGKIGLISPAQAMDLLQGLDIVYERIQDMPAESQSRMLAETQFEGILAKLRAETPRFLRDLGGAHVLREARERRNPPEALEWWFLDLHLANRRRALLKRSLRTGVIVLAVLALLVVAYNTFLAPDPVMTAIYGHEHVARDHMISGNLEAALDEVDKALELDPREPTILVLKGVLQEALGEPAAAENTFAQSEQGLNNRVTFLVTRGQAYMYINEVEKALADGQEAVQINPDSAQGWLLNGQANEMLQNFNAAIDDYDHAFAAAEKTGQTELAAISRMRLAMLMQGMGAEITLPTQGLSETP